MKKIKLFIIEFILFVYTKYIQEDLSIYKSWSKPIVYIGWLYRSTIKWLLFFVFIPEFLFRRSKLYKAIETLSKSPEFTAALANSMKYK